MLHEPPRGLRGTRIQVLRRLYGRHAPWMNVLSIGDSTVERTAIMEVMWRSDHEAWHMNHMLYVP